MAAHKSLNGDPRHLVQNPSHNVEHFQLWPKNKAIESDIGFCFFYFGSPLSNPFVSSASLTSNDLSTSTGLPHLLPSKSKLHLQPQFAAIDDQPSSLFWSSTGLRVPLPYQDNQLSTPTPQQPDLTTSPSVRPPFDGLSTTEEVADGEIINGDDDRLPPLNLSVLADAAKCVQMEQSLREARDFLDGLLTRLSVPADLCTSFENLLPEDGEEEEAEENRRSEMRRTMPTRLPVPPVSSPPAFSPVFKHLLSLPESQVLSGVSGLTPAYRCLMDLCSQVYAAIDQSKKKLRLIQRIRGRKRREERLERERAQQQSVKLCEVNSSSSSSRRQDSRRHQRQQELTKRQHRFRDALGQLVTAVAASSSADVVPTPSLGSEVWPPPRLASPGYSDPSECPLSFLSLLTSIKVPSPPVVGTDRSAVSTQELLVDISSPGLQTNYSGLHSVICAA
ncbi:unnamed protein product [Dibothriocephalus latus]|uniref:Uncharacterized protein n=1 Tax=Dibothriocephalus latus TaxID=60516 RepID=A0A3P6TYW2_DIBLA|nr:unnamed protein product [Dibothriocephalus latus]